MSFDLKKRPSAEAVSEIGFTFDPTWPGTDEPIGMSITVRGPRSAAVRAYARQKYDRAQARELAARRRGKDAEPLTLDELDDQLTDMAVIYTMGWAGVEADGQPVPFSPDAARQLFLDHPWLRERVIAEAQELGNFIKPSSTSSTSTPAPSST